MPSELTNRERDLLLMLYESTKVTMMAVGVLSDTRRDKETARSNVELLRQKMAAVVNEWGGTLQPDGSITWKALDGTDEPPDEPRLRPLHVRD